MAWAAYWGGALPVELSDRGGTLLFCFYLGTTYFRLYETEAFGVGSGFGWGGEWVNGLLLGGWGLGWFGG